uniref:Uncharacterized protein n=1 Tax=Mustela putorius furo TaxID=9669 RepID=M3YNV5_MUSPF
DFRKANCGLPDHRTGFLQCLEEGFTDRGWGGGRWGKRTLGGSGEGHRVARAPLASFPARLAGESTPATLGFPSRTPRATPGTPRTLTIRPHREARQTEQEQRRRPELDAGAASLGSHGPSVHARLARARAPAAGAAARPLPLVLHSAVRTALCFAGFAPRSPEGGARTAQGGRAPGAAALGPLSSRGSHPRRRGGGWTRLRLRAGHLEASVPKEAAPDAELPGRRRGGGWRPPLEQEGYEKEDSNLPASL